MVLFKVLGHACDPRCLKPTILVFISTQISPKRSIWEILLYEWRYSPASIYTKMLITAEPQIALCSVRRF